MGPLSGERFWEPFLTGWFSELAFCSHSLSVIPESSEFRHGLDIPPPGQVGVLPVTPTPTQLLFPPRSALGGSAWLLAFIWALSKPLALGVLRTHFQGNQTLPSRRGY